MISVIIPCFNCINTIARTIASVRYQHIKNIEIVCVDDRSTDGTKELLLKLNEERKIQKLILLSNNSGVSVARNIGYANAKYELVTQIDSDDLMLPLKLRREIRLLENGFDIAYSNYLIRKKYFIKFVNVSSPTKINKTAFLERRYPLPRDLLMKKSIFDSVGGYDETLKVYEDWDLKLKLLLCKLKWGKNELPGLIYDKRVGGLSKNKKNIQYKEKVYQKYLHLGVGENT